MSFDASWFSEFRKVTGEVIEIARAKEIDGFLPSLGELCPYHLVHTAFYAPVLDLIRDFENTHYKFSRDFVTYPSHICDFPKSESFS
jgi:hypothetical protein